MPVVDADGGDRVRDRLAAEPVDIRLALRPAEGSEIEKRQDPPGGACIAPDSARFADETVDGLAAGG